MSSRVFQIVVRGGKFTPPPAFQVVVVGRIRNFPGEVIFLLGGGNLRRSDFDCWNLFQNYKQLSVNTERQLKSKLALPVCPKSIKLKQK